MLNSSSHLLLVFATIHLVSNNYSFAQDLAAVRCSPRLPTKRDSVSSMYDGDDTIYVFGGIGDSGSETETLKYSISQDTLIETAEQLPFTAFGGGIITNKLGNIYYLTGTGSNYAEDIFQYFPETESFANASKLDTKNYDFAIIKTDEDSALIIGGRSDRSAIQRLNLNTLESERIAEYPKERREYSISGIWVEEQGVAYIFDGDYGFENVTKYDVSTNEFEFLPNYFPNMWGGSQAVWDGRYGYIVGGFGSTISDVPYDSIMQFDPQTGDIKFIRVEGYPGWSRSGFFDTSAVYVEKLNRIYMFGGYTSNGAYRYRDEIWYISLDPLGEATTTEANTPIPTLNPEIFNCVGLGESTHPYPGDCAKYVVCRDDHAYGFDCPNPFLFHPLELECMWPDLVECDADATTTTETS